MASIMYASVQYCCNQITGWRKLFCHYSAALISNVINSVSSLIVRLIICYKKMLLQLLGGNYEKTICKIVSPGGNCEKVICKIQLPGGNYEKAIYKMELPGGDCQKTNCKIELLDGNSEKHFFWLRLPSCKLIAHKHSSWFAIPNSRASLLARPP